MPESLERSHPRAHLIRNPRSSLWLTAVHEAGHAVVCLATGGTFRHATLRKTSWTSGHVDMIDCLSPELTAIVGAAGFTAESAADTHGMKAAWKAQEKAPKGTIVLPRAHHTSAGDIDLLRGIVKEHSLDFGKILDSATAATHVLCSPIEAVAVALMEPKPLRSLNFLEIEVAMGGRSALWRDAAERLLDVEEVTGKKPDGWLIGYVRDRLSVA